MTDLLTWLPPAYKGDLRRVALCGEAPVGAVFEPAGGRYWRWQCWHALAINPSNGAARSEPEAKQEVEKRFRQFLDAADLEPLRRAR